MVDNEKLLQKLIDFTSEKHPAEYGEMLRESIVSIPVEKRVSPTKRKILTKQVCTTILTEIALLVNLFFGSFVE